VGRVFIPPPPEAQEEQRATPAIGYIPRERSPARARRSFSENAATRRRGFTEQPDQAETKRRRFTEEGTSLGPGEPSPPKLVAPATMTTGVPQGPQGHPGDSQGDSLAAFGLQPRASEMRPGELPSNQRMCAGIGGWLPSSELQRYSSPEAAAAAAAADVAKAKKEGMFEENKLDEGNLGYQMLQSAGWAGAGLGAKASGTEDPLAVKVKRGKEGLGTTAPDVAQANDDAYELYKKRMMRAYQYRPGLS